MNLAYLVMAGIPVLFLVGLIVLHRSLVEVENRATGALQLPSDAAPGTPRRGFIDSAELLFFLTVATGAVSFISAFIAVMSAFPGRGSALYGTGVNYVFAALSAAVAVYGLVLTIAYSRRYSALFTSLERNVQQEQTEFFGSEGYELAQDGVFIAPYAERVGKNPEERQVFARSGGALVELAITPRVSATPLIRVV